MASPVATAELNFNMGPILGLDFSEEVLETAEKDVAGRIRQNIRQSKGEGGTLAPLKESTIAAKKRKGYHPADRPLQATGAMRDGIRARKVGVNHAVVEPTNKPEVAGYHQEGHSRGHFPARPFFSLTARNQSHIMNRLKLRMTRRIEKAIERT